jgi:hypothetical protein
MATAAIDFRPFVEANGIYNTGLAGVAVTNAGQLATSASPGIGLVWGVSGMHSWRHTKLGLDYRGSLDHYTQETKYDTTNQQMLLSVDQMLNRHTQFGLRATAGTFSYNFGLPGLTPTVTFDPNGVYIPHTDFFDNRTSYATAAGDFTLRKSARLSFSIGGQGSIVSRLSSALYGVVSGSGRGDVQYRVRRSTTIGAFYTYQHYSFTRVTGGTDLHGAAGTYSWRVSRWLELSGYGGFMRVESKFLQAVPVDPVIAVILGISYAPQIYHSISYAPNLGGRLSRTFRTGVAYISAGHSYVPGNGLFLTSAITSVMGGYGYTGLRRWSFHATAQYDDSQAAANVSGGYGDYGFNLSASRQITRGLNSVVNYYARRYQSGDFTQYNRWIQTVRVGVGYTPGDLPLRIW